MNRFRALRIALLLAIFIGASFYAKTQKLKSRAWIEPLEAVIYPINAENVPAVEQYIASLNDGIFTEIDAFFRREGEFYQLIGNPPVDISLGPSVTVPPPPSPTPSANFAAIVWWGLKLRFWAYRHTPDHGSNLKRIRIFVQYHEAEAGKILQHSVGLEKGLFAVVHAFASEQQESQNNIVIAHELLHTVGATDKYDTHDMPLYPQGYAAPDQRPLYPQTRAEIMAARIPLSPATSIMADSLDQCLIGPITATEINWLKASAK